MNTKSTNMAATRDLLLPGFRAVLANDWDLFIDYTRDELVAQGHGRRVVLVTKPEIDDGSYKTTFGPRIHDLKGQNHG